MRIFLNNTKCSGSGKSDGFSLVEALLAVALFALFSYGLATAYFYGQEASVLAGERARAVLYAQEGIEAVRSIRGDDFVNLEDGTFGLEIIAGQWELSGNSDTDDIFNREIDISSETDDIKQISSTVTWQQNKQRDGDEAASTWETFIELNDSSIYDTWNADYTFVSGGVYQVTPLSWNGNVDPGETIDSPGFCANKTGPNFAPNITEEP